MTTHDVPGRGKTETASEHLATGHDSGLYSRIPRMLRPTCPAQCPHAVRRETEEGITVWIITLARFLCNCCATALRAPRLGQPGPLCLRRNFQSPGRCNQTPTTALPGARSTRRPGERAQGRASRVMPSAASSIRHPWRPPSGQSRLRAMARHTLGDNAASQQKSQPRATADFASARLAPNSRSRRSSARFFKA